LSNNYQSILHWFKWLFILNFISQMLSRILNGSSGSRKWDWIPLAVFGGVTLLVAGQWVAPKIKQSNWLYRLYRYRSPAVAAGQLVLPNPSPGILERLYLHIHPPKWCRTSQDDLMIIYRDQDKLLREGMIALCVLIQANALLFEKGAGSAPANVLYTTDLEIVDPLKPLYEIAYKIGSLKNTKPDDPDELKFARMISYEYGRDFRVSVPDSLSEGLDVTYTTIMVHRKHLPFGYITNFYFPLLIHQESRAAMILPARYWPDELISEWMPRKETAA
jgi:hypothetical protein